MFQQHLGLGVVIMLVGFLIGVFGHITRSVTMILIGIVIIAVVSLLIVGATTFGAS